MRGIARRVALAAALVATAAGGSARAGGTLEAVVARAELRCGVPAEPAPGFAERDAEGGGWRGFHVDYCRAVAAAVIGDAAAAVFVPLTPDEHLAAVTAGRIDVLAAGTSWTLTRDAGGDVDFPAVTYFDAQGFLVPEELGVRSALELDGARVCTLAAGGALDRLATFFSGHLMEHVVVLLRRPEELFAAYDAGLCDAVTADLSRLAAARRHLDEPQAHVVLPEVVAKDPLALAVRASDPAWADVVRWVHMALLAAEEVGLTAALAAASPADVPAATRRLLQRAAARSGALGLERAWARRAVAAVGHYGEMFERHLGTGTGVGLERGPNALWRDGGLHYPLPFR